ncbi:ArsR/SmtB family transcription factor [Micromonospora okii]|uniref:ArsR/SmtB family transcription factor n=1 Tax=Micromonospora okii TaxID=1182970 RepID=UPI001E5AD1F5|nr:winged helix-turn-helix domain-containing protein [Micromonospora okii]
MIRILFTPDDLVRVRIAEAPDPMWEVLLSIHLLQGRPEAPGVRQWWQRYRRQPPPAARLLAELAPPRGYSPDFLTPPAGTYGLTAGIEALLATRPRQLSQDLRRLAEQRRPTPLTRSLARAEPASLRLVADAVRDYHRTALAPYWPVIRAAVSADRASRLRALSGHGFEGMVGSLHPDVRWRAPVLEVHGTSITRDVVLGGRGLRLIPSYFCWRRPTLLRDPELPPVLVYPVEHRPALIPGQGQGQAHAAAGGGTRATGPGGTDAGTPGNPDIAWPPPPVDAAGDGSLAALLGGTRAAVLTAVGAGCGTTELARRVGVSAATASQHASVLRAAGLIDTRRTGGAVLHTLRPLGRYMLTSGAAVAGVCQQAG